MNYEGVMIIKKDGRSRPSYQIDSVTTTAKHRMNERHNVDADCVAMKSGSGRAVWR